LEPLNNQLGRDLGDHCTGATCADQPVPGKRFGVALNPGAQMGFSSVVRHDRNPTGRCRSGEHATGHSEYRAHLRRKALAFSREGTLECGRADSEAGCTRFGGGGEPFLAVDATRHHDRFRYGSADSAHQAFDIAPIPIGEEIEPMNMFQIRQLPRAFRNFLLGAFQDARMADDPSGKRVVAHRMIAGDLRDEVRAGASEKAIDVECHRRAGGFELALLVQANHFKIGSSASLADRIRERLEIGERQADILETYMPRPALQCLVQPRPSVRNGAVIGCKHQNEVEGHCLAPLLSLISSCMERAPRFAKR
jgi:hypothetical protein